MRRRSFSRVGYSRRALLQGRSSFYQSAACLLITGSFLWREKTEAQTSAMPAGFSPHDGQSSCPAHDPHAAACCARFLQSSLPYPTWFSRTCSSSSSSISHRAARQAHARIDHRPSRVHATCSMGKQLSGEAFSATRSDWAGRGQVILVVRPLTLAGPFCSFSLSPGEQGVGSKARPGALRHLSPPRRTGCCDSSGHGAMHAHTLLPAAAAAAAARLSVPKRREVVALSFANERQPQDEPLPLAETFPKGRRAPVRTLGPLHC